MALLQVLPAQALWRGQCVVPVIDRELLVSVDFPQQAQSVLAVIRPAHGVRGRGRRRLAASVRLPARVGSVSLADDLVQQHAPRFVSESPEHEQYKPRPRLAHPSGSASVDGAFVHNGKVQQVERSQPPHHTLEHAWRESIDALHQMRADAVLVLHHGIQVRELPRGDVCFHECLHLGLQRRRQRHPGVLGENKEAGAHVRLQTSPGRDKLLGSHADVQRVRRVGVHQARSPLQGRQRAETPSMRAFGGFDVHLQQQRCGASYQVRRGRTVRGQRAGSARAARRGTCACRDTGTTRNGR